jgi:hypothetical protein
MNFIIGIVLAIVVILILFNFASFSISDTKYGGGSCPQTKNQSNKPTNIYINRNTNHQSEFINPTNYNPSKYFY